jgi:ribosome-associated translation inhibitor RaiA
MKIQIRQHDSLVTEALRTYALRRLGFALGRFGESVGDVIVQFSDGDGTDGGIDQRCQIQVGLPRSVKVEETGGDLFVAVDRAADRASRAVARSLARYRESAEGLPRPRSRARTKP